MRRDVNEIPYGNHSRFLFHGNIFYSQEKKFENRRKLAIWMRWKWRIIDFLLSKKENFQFDFLGENYLKWAVLGWGGRGRGQVGGHITSRKRVWGLISSGRMQFGHALARFPTQFFYFLFLFFVYIWHFFIIIFLI